MKSRLYAVRAIIGASEKEYLVDAGSRNAARLHVAKKHVEASIASGQDVAKLMAKGVKPESAVDALDEGELQAALPGMQDSATAEV